MNDMSERQRRAMDEALGSTQQPPRRKPPAGWYPHPTMVDTRRYWDGDRWTDRIALATEKPADGPTRSGWSGTTKTLVIFGILVAGVVVILGLVFVGGPEGGGESGAKDVCEQYVTDRLKSPASAEFSEAFGVEQQDGSWIVRGSVDSQNGFGAMIRNQYTCRVRPTGGDDWSLDKLTTTGK